MHEFSIKNAKVKTVAMPIVTLTFISLIERIDFSVYCV